VSILDTLPPSGGSWLRHPETGALIPLAQPGADIDAEAVMAEVLNAPDEPPAAPAEEE
jgi:hypothetical protein